MDFKSIFTASLEKAKEEIKSFDLNAAYALGLSKSKNHLQGSHTVVTYPPLDSMETVQDTNLAQHIKFPEEINAYIHIPLCDYRCTFCHYLTVHSANTHKTPHNGISYLTALKKEMSEWGKLLKGKGSKVCSLYIGGGTPTVLSPDKLDNLLIHAYNVLPFTTTKDICIETSPKSFFKNHALLDVFKKNHITRISMGVQSFHPAALKAGGRFLHNHKPQSIEEAATLALHNTGIDNINIDMLQDLPLPLDISHMDVLQYDLRKIYELKPSHITWYNMRLCPESLFNYSHTDKDGKKYFRIHQSSKLYYCPNQQESLYARLLIWNFLTNIGYQVLEGDRFALENKYEDKFRKARGSVTSALLGMGAASYSHIDNIFFRNVANNPKKLSSPQEFLAETIDTIHKYIEIADQSILPIQSFQKIPVGEKIAGLFALGLKREINYRKILTKYINHKDCRAYLKYSSSLINLMLSAGLLEEINETLRLTKFGRLFENEICQKFYSPKIRYLSHINRETVPPEDIHNNYLYYVAS